MQCTYEYMQYIYEQYVEYIPYISTQIEGIHTCILFVYSSKHVYVQYVHTLERSERTVSVYMNICSRYVDMWIVHMNTHSAVFINTNWGNVHVYITCMIHETSTSVCTICTYTRKKWMYSLQYIWTHAVDIRIGCMNTNGICHHNLEECTCVHYVYPLHVFVRVHERRGSGLGSRPIFKKFNEPYAPS